MGSKLKIYIYVSLFFIVFFACVFFFYVWAFAEETETEYRFYYDSSTDSFYTSDDFPEGCTKYLRMRLSDTNNDGLYDDISFFKEYNNYWSDVWNESETYSTDIMYFLSDGRVYYSYNDMTGATVDNIDSYNATFLMSGFPADKVSSSFCSKYHTIGIDYIPETPTDVPTTEEPSTEEPATYTDAFTVGEETTVETHLRNIELLLLILVVIIVAFVVHILFRSVFGKLGK